jgi:hypothetical protein
MADRDVSLTISLTAGDLRHASHILPHQIRQLGAQVEHVVLNVDTRARSIAPSAAGPSAGSAQESFHLWLESLTGLHPRMMIRDIDYSDEVQTKVTRAFYGGGPVPPRIDFRGRPIYSSLEPLLTAPTEWVLHLDSDMLIGGGSATWVAEAQNRMTVGAGHVLASPYPGPPRPDGRVLRQPGVRYLPDETAVLVPNMSWRVFLMHVPTFIERVCPLRLLPAPWKGRLWTLREPNPPYEKVELAVTARMVQLGLTRIDLLGAAPGMWSLHPPYRSESFYSRLPEVVNLVEKGDVPAEQQGDFDLNDSVIDWSDARRALRRSRIKTMVLGSRGPTRRRRSD